MEYNPKVSIIVPVYNYEKYVGKCIESLINQSYRNIEPIIVDDGSTDDSGKIIDEYALKDSRIKAYHKANGGIGSAVKEALAHVTGEYIAFLDSDDYMELDAYENLVKVAAETDADIVLFGLVMKGLDGRIVGRACSKEETIIGKKNVVKDYLFKDAVTPLSRKFCKRELFQNLSMLNHSVGIDEAISIQLISRCNKMVKIEDSYYVALGDRAKDSVSRRAIDGENMQEQLQVQRDIISYFFANNIPYVNDYIIRHLCFLTGRYVTLSKLHGNSKREDKESIREEFAHWYYYIKQKQEYGNAGNRIKVQMWVFSNSPDMYGFIRGMWYKR